MPTYSNTYDRGQFGVAGGYMGTGVELQPELEKVYKRLLSPAEWEQQDQQVRSAFGGYMNYVNAFTSRQRSKTAGKSAYSAAKAGTFEPQGSGVSYGAPTSTRGRIPTAGKGGVAIPRTTIHKDIYGRPTEELAGGGVQRGMGGEVIPQTAEQYGEQIRLDRAIPTTELEADIDFLGKVAKKKELQSTVAFNKRQEALVRAEQAGARVAQGATRLAQQKQAKEDINKRFEKVRENRVALEDQRQKHRKELKNISKEYDIAKLGIKDVFDRATRREEGKIVGSPEDIQKRKADIADELRILRVKQKIARDKETRKVLRDLEIIVLRGAAALDNIDLKDWTGTATGKVGPVREAQRQRAEDAAQKLVGETEELMAQGEFVADFETQVGRAPSQSELVKAKGKYWN